MAKNRKTSSTRTRKSVRATRIGPRRKSAAMVFREDSPPYRVEGESKPSHAVNYAAEKGKPRLLDLFCCAGGVAVGYSRAGFEVVGVDIEPQPNFPFDFIQADALTLPMDFMKSFDAIHASPPCQSYSDLAKRNGNGHEWPRLIEPVREMLIKTGKPYIIENVDGQEMAPRPARDSATSIRKKMRLISEWNYGVDSCNEFDMN